MVNCRMQKNRIQRITITRRIYCMLGKGSSQENYRRWWDQEGTDTKGGSGSSGGGMEEVGN